MFISLDHNELMMMLSFFFSSRLLPFWRAGFSYFGVRRKNEIVQLLMMIVPRTHVIC